MPPLLILAIAVALVLGLILALRLNAFLALITTAVVVSLLAPGELGEKIPRVAEAFGAAAGKIGVPIAMAAVIGSCLLASGAAARIVQALLAVFGEKRGAAALAASGFTLSIPVFFDTVFFLLVPLAKSLYGQTGRHYLKILLAMGVGGSIAHSLVPPTPGPLLVADQLGVDIGLMMLIGIASGLPMLGVGLLMARWLDRRVLLANLPLRESPAEETAHEASSEPTMPGPTMPGPALPGLGVSILPILLPVVLVASQTIVATWAEDAAPSSPLHGALTIANVIGNPNLALLIAAAVALGVFAWHKRPTRAEAAAMVEESLMSGGLIILITAAGGAFGAMLKAAQIGPAIEAVFSNPTAAASPSADGGMAMGLLWLGFGISSLLKFSQGSSTVAMIGASGMLAAMIEGQSLPYNPVYIAQAIGCGAMFGTWMNDSGFWIFCKMGGLTEAEGLKTWTPILAVIAMTGMLVTAALAVCMPLADFATP